jgi:hypothetical protein
MEHIETGKDGKKLKSMLFLFFLVLFGFLVAFHNFDRYFLLKDYPVSALTPCDPSLHSCFEIDQELAFFPTQTGPYAKVTVNAAIAPACLDEHNCGNFYCEKFIDGGKDCEVIYCTSQNIEDGESCVGNEKINPYAY